MDLKILGKRVNKNLSNEVNEVYIELDGEKYSIPIIYIEKLKLNAFIQREHTTDYDKMLKYVTSHYPNLSEKDIKDYFIYKLYKYSRGVNLNPVREINLEDVTPVW